MELDGSTDTASDKQQSTSSNHPTPCTNKSSSSSYSPHSNNQEHQNLPKQPQQQQQQSGSQINSASVQATAGPPTSTTAESTFFETFKNNTIATTNPTTLSTFPSTVAEHVAEPLGNQNPFAFLQSWEHDIQRGQSRHNEDFAGDTGLPPDFDLILPSFDQVNWAPTPSMTDWNNWANQ